MANEKKTIKTKLVQVGSEKIDMPFSLSEFILDSTSGKTVKELLDELDIEIGNPATDDTLATGLYKAIEDIDLTDYQTKTDDTLVTTDKTIVGAINELDTNIDNIKTEIGKKKIPGTPEVVEEYVACLQTDDGALEVVADGGVTDNNTQIELTTANSLGGSFSIGEYVKHVPHVDAVPEVPGTGMYKFVEDSINQALVGGEVDLSGYQEKVDNNLTTDDKNLVNVINALADDSHYHEAFTDAEIEQMFTDLTPDEVQMYQNLINDQTISTNRLFSSQGVVDRITEALLQSQKYANDLVKNMNSMTCKVLDTKPDTGEELVLYLIGASGNYHQWMFIEGAWADLGSTNITLNGYITEEKLTEELAKKADDDKVLKLDKVTTTMSGTPSNDNVLSELAVKNLLDGKADSTSIPTVTNDLTDDLKANYDAAYTHSQTTHFDGDYNNLTNKPTIPTVTTTIDSTSTDTQIPSAKAIYNMSGVKYFTEEEINSYGNSTFLSGIVNKTIAATIIPNAVDYYNLIKLPWDSKFNSQIWISACGRQDAYIRHTKIEGVWDTPKKICTTKVADVPVTDVEFTDSNVSKTGEFEICKYYVKNGYAYVTLNALTFNSSYTSGSPFATLPRPVFRYSISLSNAYNTVNLGKLFIEPNGEIHLYSNSIPTTELGFVTFSYPVAES